MIAATCQDAWQSDRKKRFDVRRLLISWIAIGVLVGVLPGTAAARIIPGQGIAGVRIGDSEAQVRNVLGRPRKVIPPSWGYATPLNGRVSFNHRRRVNDVWTTNHGQRTRKGIGPGSSLKQMRATYHHARCYAAKQGKRSLCTLVFRSHRRTVKTDFLFRGRLRVVDVYEVSAPIKPGPE